MIFSYLVHLGVNYWKKPNSDYFPIDSYFTELPTEDKAWRETTDFIAQNGFNMLLIDLGEGVQYESHPEIAVKGAWSKEKLKKELDRLRSIGLTPIPKLNFASIHNCWMGEYSNMVSTPIYYKVVEDLIAEAIELFDNPEYLHLGMDEEAYSPYTSFNCLQMQEKYGVTIARTNKLYWEDLDFMAKCCLKRGVRPWIWGDAGWFIADDMIKNLSRDVLVSNWYYQRWLNPQLLADYHRTAMDTFYMLAKNGFDQVPTGATYSTPSNIDDMMLCLKDKPNILGYMSAPWFRCREIDTLKHKSEAKIFNIAKTKYYGE